MDVVLDADRHLADPTAWSEAVARVLAEEEGVELGANHWRVVAAVRRFYQETGVSPSMRPLVKLLREREGDDFASSIALMRLFPGSPATRVARIAGLPRPDKCL